MRSHFLATAKTFQTQQTHPTPKAQHSLGFFVFCALTGALPNKETTTNRRQTTVTTTKIKCSECGSFDTASYDDELIECLTCRHITFGDDPPDAYAIESWCVPASELADIAVAMCSPRKAPDSVTQAAWEEPSESKTIHDFVTICGVSPIVEVVMERYAMGGYGIQLWDNEGPLMTATRWIPGIPAGCVAIKDFDENAGCLEQLIARGVIEPPQEFLEGLPICRLRI